MERTRIGLYYVWDESWIGGAVYIQNLLKALNSLDDKDKPFIDVYCWYESAFEKLKNNTQYPYLAKQIVKDELVIKKIYRKIYGLLFGLKAKAGLDRFKLLPKDILLFPFPWGSKTKKLVYWRPDFQEKYMPELFSKREIRRRDEHMRMACERNVIIVFSSYDSEKDFKKFYPGYNNKTFVMHFAVHHADFSNIAIEELKKKYCICGDYLMCANQFWKHKNHLFLFKAYKKALKNGLKLKLVCTGKLSDYRNPEYIEEIKRYIANEKLSDNIILLGLIEMDELHCLMKNSYAVVQPSLFEGWNTTVEDCKALNKFVYLSKIPVHQEQIKENVCFFDPYDEDDLAMKLLKVKPEENFYDYSCNLREFGNSFLNIIKYVKDRNSE